MKWRSIVSRYEKEESAREANPMELKMEQNFGCWR